MLIREWPFIKCGGGLQHTHQKCYSFPPPPPPHNFESLTTPAPGGVKNLPKPRMFTYKIAYIFYIKEKIENCGLKKIYIYIDKNNT